MSAFWIGFSALLLWAACLAVVSIWSRRDTWGRTAIIVLFAVSIPILSVTFGAALGNPRPISWEQLRQKEDVSRRLLGYKIIYEVGIYLLLDMAGKPVYLELGWNTEVAEELEAAAREAGEDGGVWMKMPYETSLNKNPPQFYADPQPKFLPDKPQPESPMVYERN